MSFKQKRKALLGNDFRSCWVHLVVSGVPKLSSLLETSTSPHASAIRVWLWALNPVLIKFSLKLHPCYLGARCSFPFKTKLYWRYIPHSTQGISLHLKESSQLNTQVEPALTSRIWCRFILLFISAIYSYSIWCASLMHRGCTCKTSQDLDLAKHWWGRSKETMN